MAGNDLIERLCRSLAFHVIESEVTLECIEDDCVCDGAAHLRGHIEAARGLVAEAGFDIDVLYPLEQRPTAVEPH